MAPGCPPLSLKSFDSYGDGINAFFKAEYFEAGSIEPLPQTNYFPAFYGFFDGPGRGNGSPPMDLGDKLKLSIIPTMKDAFEPCDVGVNANATDCATINEPWELAWAVQDQIQLEFMSITPRTYYGGVDSVLELRCDTKMFFGGFNRKLKNDYFSPGTYVDLNNYTPLITENIATKPSVKPRSKEYAGPRPVCQGINLDLVDKTGEGWFSHEKLLYSEYIVSSDNKVVVRGTMEKPAFHETVELKIPDGDYLLRVPSLDDWASMNNHGWTLSQDKTSVTGTAYEQLQFTVRDCKLTPGPTSNFLDTPPIGFPFEGPASAPLSSCLSTCLSNTASAVDSASILVADSVIAPSSFSSSALPLESALVVAGVVAGLVVGKFVLPKFKASYEPVVDVSSHNANLRA